MDVTLLYFDSCPNWKTADARLATLADEQGFTVTHRRVIDQDHAESIGFRGSPTVLINGHDPFAAEDAQVGMSCRIYQTPEGPAGAPTIAQLRHALAHQADQP